MRWLALAVAVALAACSGSYLDAPDASINDASGCPSPPDCNWCGGYSRVDGAGCVTGYTCPNGDDSCATPTCLGAPGVCGPGEACATDGLCWPTNLICSQIGCTGFGTQSCACSWDCGGGGVYETRCEGSPKEFACDCLIGGNVIYQCSTTSWTMGQEICGYYGCCNFMMLDGGPTFPPG